MNQIRLDVLTEQHTPNVPRDHNARGDRVDEPTQCRRCLQSWPCETRQLLDLVETSVEIPA